MRIYGGTGADPAAVRAEQLERQSGEARRLALATGQRLTYSLTPHDYVQHSADGPHRITDGQIVRLERGDALAEPGDRSRSAAHTLKVAAWMTGTAAVAFLVGYLINELWYRQRVVAPGIGYGGYGMYGMYGGGLLP